MALKKEQKSIDAINISSFNKNANEVLSRYVNLKYIIDQQWIFFSNYDSKKALDFNSHNQISASFYWDSIDVQIRIKAKIKKTSNSFSDKHFKNRSVEKNALAISSHQSNTIRSYEDVVKNYQKTFNGEESLLKRPSYWGGYAFTPYYFEFWEGHPSRVNKREVFKKIDDLWKQSFLQP
tara:strand:+ start:403 stop:939 length:537 start_codon:yes stop_codon:yes gene_type:complete